MVAWLILLHQCLCFYGWRDCMLWNVTKKKLNDTFILSYILLPLKYSKIWWYTFEFILPYPTKQIHSTKFNKAVVPTRRYCMIWKSGGKIIKDFTFNWKALTFLWLARYFHYSYISHHTLWRLRFLLQFT